MEITILRLIGTDINIYSKDDLINLDHLREIIVKGKITELDIKRIEDSIRTYKQNDEMYTYDIAFEVMIKKLKRLGYEVIESDNSFEIRVW